MSQFVRFTIDGTECMATRGQFLVDAAKENGIYVPTLCNYPGVKPKGSCRICTVRVNGKLMTACTTPVAEGMNIENEVKDINELRRSIIELLFVEGNHFCPAGQKSRRLPSQNNKGTESMHSLQKMHQGYPGRKRQKHFRIPAEKCQC
jgi:predicted molibdopterin-dependent oxidoreductase YjgC